MADPVALVDVTDRDDPRSSAGGHDRGVVGAAIVEDDQLVDDAVTVDQRRTDRVHE